MLERARFASAVCRPVPTTSTRSAPRCSAGLIGAIWRTGDAARDASVKQALGFEADQHLIGFIYVGYPEFTPEIKERPSFEDRTVWME